MKAKQFIFTLLAFFASITASAETWTDANGTEWYFYTNGSNATIANRGYNHGDYIPSISGTIPTELIIPQTVYIGGTPYTVTSIGEFAFRSCSSLTSIAIPDDVTLIGEEAFAYCSCLTSVNIPNGVTSISNRVFWNCSNLTSINIPNNVISIGIGALAGCSSLTYINIPERVTSIGSAAFQGISRVNFQSTIPATISGNIGDDYTVYFVPASAKATYCSAENWTDFATQIVATSEWNDADITVTAQDKGSGIQYVIGESNLEDVSSLKVNGSINGYDFLILRQKMPNLRILDMEDANVVANDFIYFTGNHSEDNVLGAYAFYQTKLHSIILPSSIVSIGTYAFSGCKNLNYVKLNGALKIIDQGVFAECSSLNQIIFNDGLQEINPNAFYWCSMLSEINLPESVTRIGSTAFYHCNLKKIHLPKHLKSIEFSAFSNNNLLSIIEFPEGLETIGSGAFNYCTNIKTVLVKTPEPITIPDGVFPTSISSATLYVPELATSREKYYWANGWSGFLNHVEYHPEYDTFYLTDDYEVGDGKDQFSGEGDNDPNADLRPESGFIKEGEEDTQNLGDVDQNINGNGSGASIIGKDDGENAGNLVIDNLNIKISVNANTWYFFCFPYDVFIESDCTYPGDYVWKEYQGSERASNGKGWRTVPGNKLHAQNGYAFKTTTTGILTVTIKQPKFGGSRTSVLTEYPADNAQNASWNFVGNPYSCYFDFQESAFDAPITVWNGTTYEAFNPADDDYHLRPYEAFFVQKMNITDDIQFDEDYRETYKQSQKKQQNQVRERRARGLNPERLLLNLYITDEEASVVDKTRVVLNDKASRSYEMKCDAAKFISTDANAQLYSLEGTTQYSINERPANGDIRLGYIAQKAGKLSIGAGRMDQQMILVDTELNVTFDLSLGTYDFETKAGSFDGRFLLRASNEQTGINALRQQTGTVIGTQPGGIALGGAEGKTISVYTTGGAKVAEQDGNGFVALKSGVYVVSVDGVSAKVNVK